MKASRDSASARGSVDQMRFKPRSKSNLSKRSAKMGKSDGPRSKVQGSFKLKFDQFLLKFMKGIKGRVFNKALGKQKEKVQKEVFAMFDQAVDNHDTQTIQWLGSRIKNGDTEMLGHLLRKAIIADGNSQNNPPGSNLSGDNVKALVAGLKFEGIGEDIKFQDENGNLTREALDKLSGAITKTASIGELERLINAKVLSPEKVREAQEERKDELLRKFDELLPVAYQKHNYSKSSEALKECKSIMDDMLRIGINLGQYVSEQLEVTYKNEREERIKNLKAFLIIECMSESIDDAVKLNQPHAKLVGIKTPLDAKRSIQDLSERSVGKIIKALVEYHRTPEAIGWGLRGNNYMPLRINSSTGFGNLTAGFINIGKAMAKSGFFNTFPRELAEIMVGSMAMFEKKYFDEEQQKSFDYTKSAPQSDNKTRSDRKEKEYYSDEIPGGFESEIPEQSEPVRMPTKEEVKGLLEQHPKGSLTDDHKIWNELNLGNMDDYKKFLKEESDGEIQRMILLRLNKGSKRRQAIFDMRK